MHSRHARAITHTNLPFLRDQLTRSDFKYLEGSFKDRGGFEDDQHHRPRMLPFRQFIQNSQQIDAGEEVAPAVGPRRVGTAGQGARGIRRSIPWEC